MFVNPKLLQVRFLDFAVFLAVQLERPVDAHNLHFQQLGQCGVIEMDKAVGGRQGLDANRVVGRDLEWPRP